MTTDTRNFYEPTTITITFRDNAGVLIDPTTVTVMLMSPSGLVAEYPGAGTVSHPSTGVYTIQFLPDEWGPWPWRATGAGNIAIVEEGTIWVAYSVFAATLAEG